VKAQRTLAMSPSVVSAVEAADQAYQGRDQAEIDAAIAKIDKAWQAEDASVSALVDEISAYGTSAYLKSFVGAFPEEVEVFVTDNQGLNIAMMDRTLDYLQADEGWCREPPNNHLAAFN
jgi:hypothetical protein